MTATPAPSRRRLTAAGHLLSGLLAAVSVILLGDPEPNLGARQR